MKSALEENKTKAAEASAVSNALKPGVTIDLSHRGIQRFPDEVVDIIKNELERLALSHNQISTFPSRFAECTSLRYLNVRNNLIREFPLCICQLKSLEILDLGRNKLRVLPPELVSLTSLKVLSVQKNRIEDLPLCLADMASLQVLKLDGNPVRFPPREIMTAQSMSPPNGGFLKESEIDEVSITTQIKRFLKQKAIADRSDADFGADEESSEGAETPRPAFKRLTSGRFPVKVNGTDMPDLRSPALPRPPPIPSRSHYRGLSQQNAALRRPGVMPLTIGNSNERLRSNSEGLIQASRERERSRRGGLASKRRELDTVDEGNPNRVSHYRGLSHGSAMTGSNGVVGNVTLRSPSSPADGPQRPIYVRRLSSLPERKRESRSPDPIMEGAKGILYALFQIHPLIQSLIVLVRDGNNKRTSLERVFYNASTHLEELDRDIQNFGSYSEDDEGIPSQTIETVHSACLTCISAYLQVCGLLSKNVATLLDNGDPRYIRTLLLMVYGTLAEVRNAGASLFINRAGQQTNLQATVRTYIRDRSVTPTRDRPNPTPRIRAAAAVTNGAALRVATDVLQPAMLNGGQRSNTMTTMLSAATPRSGESFVSSGSGTGSRNTPTVGEFTREDQLFERIFLQLQQSSEMGIQTLPVVNSHFVAALKATIKQGNPGQLKQLWQLLSSKCLWSLQAAETLKARLSTIKLKEPGIRSQGQFWGMCNSFIQAYTELATQVKEARALTALLPIEVIVLLRPLNKAIRETTYLINTSPWTFLASSNNISNGQSPRPNSTAAISPPPQTPLPMTPQSAALGPAVMATVPSAPYANVSGISAPGHSGNGSLGMSHANNSYSNNSFNMFNGNVFERADALLSLSSTSSTRTGTMTGSLEGGGLMASNLLSPMTSMGGARFGASGKVTL